jgi:putative ABC transport system substrate-binding protein
MVRPRREKVFGPGRAVPLDRNAKARIMAYARAWGARHRQPGQHRGPITRAFLEVLEALLWGFHNARTGRCFPSYEAIAAKAECCRDTVYEALKVLEIAGVLTWAHRIARIQVREARPVRQMGEPLARHPHIQCLRVSRPAAASLRRPGFQVRKSAGNTESRDSNTYCCTSRPRHPFGGCTAATWSRYRRKIALEQGQRAGSRHLIQVRSGSVAGNRPCWRGDRMKRRDLILYLAGAMTVARDLRAQQKAMPVIGYLSGSSAGPSASNVAAFRQGLSEIGYVEGQNVAIEYRWADGHYDRLAALAVDLVGRKVDAIVATGTSGIAAARNATTTIPIVFTGGGDLVAAGLIASLARPGGNLTGISIFCPELHPKRLQLLSEVIPGTEVIALLVNPTNLVSESVVHDMQEAARTNGRRLVILKASTESEIDAALAALVQAHAGALIVASDPYFNSRREQIVALASRHAVPAIYDWREFTEAGGLMNYGPNLKDTFRQAGVYAGRVLAGAKPADMPVLQPTRFEMIINLKTAKALGLTIPQSILGRADEVIE